MKARLILGLLVPATLGFCCLPARCAENSLLSLSQYDFGMGNELLAAIEDKVRAALTNRVDALDVEEQLLAVIQSEAPLAARQFACSQLRLLASPHAISALAPLLADPTLSHCARMVLEGIPGPAAATALRQALLETHGDQLIGVINRVGERRERDSAAVLVPLLSSRDPAVVRAAIIALGKLGGLEATRALEAVAAPLAPSLFQAGRAPIAIAEAVKFRLDMGVIMDSLLECADGIARDGQTARAAELCARIAEASSVPRPSRVAAQQALVRLDSGRATAMILRLLRSNDAATEALAAGFLRDLPTNAVESVLLVLDALPVTARARVVQALADRRDASAIPATQEPDRHTDEASKTTVARDLAMFDGDAQSVRLLAERFLKATSTQERTDAANALVAVAHERGNSESCARALVEAPAPDKLETRLALCDLLGRLGGAAALTTVSQAARNGEPAERDHAIATLTAWPDSSAMDELMTISKGADNLRHHSLALRGFIGLIERPSARGVDQTLELYRQALAVALAPDDKKLAVAGLARLGHTDAAGVIEPFLSDAQLQEDAGLALVQIARALHPRSPQEARAILARVLSAITNGTVLAEARRLSDELDRIRGE